MNINKLFLQLFADYNTQVTTQDSMSPTMKTFYDTALLENARANLVFNQFADPQKIHGNKVEWRKFNTFEKALTPIVEGVTPNGSSFGMSKIEGTTTQHGDYTTVSDRLELESYDDVIYGATEEMGTAGGATFDTLTRNVLIGGNCVQYCPCADGSTITEITSRKDLNENCKLVPSIISKANTWLKKNKAPKINGWYIALIHPSVVEDLRASNEWKEYHKYNDTSPIFKGDIGDLHGVRFIESNECKVHAPCVISDGLGKLSCKTAISASSTTIVVNEVLTAKTSCSVPVYVNGAINTITKIATSSNTTTLTVSTAITSLSVNDVICGQGAGKYGSATYDTLFLGSKAYGTIEPEGESMQMIVKDKKVIGGPLELFSTIGYKFSHGAKILYQERLLRVESGSSYSAIDEEN